MPVCLKVLLSEIRAHLFDAHGLRQDSSNAVERICSMGTVFRQGSSKADLPQSVVVTKAKFG